MQASASPTGLIETHEAGNLEARQTGDFWECAVWSGGPSDQQLGQAVFFFSGVYGTEPIHLAGGRTKAAICNGMVFGFINNMGVPQTEKVENRALAAKTSTGGGQSCTWNKTNLMIGYIFGWEDNFTFDKDTTDIIRC